MAGVGRPVRAPVVPRREADGAPPLDAFERVSTTEQVLRALRAAIIDGRIEEGERLRELQLAATLGTGRGAVREAVRQLVQEGLVEHEVHRGAFVRAISAADVVDVYRAREAVELAALALLLERDELELAPLALCVERMREVASREGAAFRDTIEADVSFHETLVALAGSPRLARMYSTLAAETRMILYRYPPYPPAANADDHERILAALRARSRESEPLLREHLRFSARLAAESRREAGG